MPDIDPATLTDEQIRAVMAEAGRRSAAKRATGERACIACGVIIPDVLTTRRYCSPACQQRARYWRVKARQDDDPTAPFRTPLAGKGWESARSYTRKSTKRGKRS